jgi:hypothetical protein
MKEIIGDDYPTYEDSVNMTLAEREQSKTTNKDILLSRALHRLACIETDIKIIARHIENTCPDQFEKPSLNEDGSVYADCAWHNISNIEIACDLTDDAPLEWGSKKKVDISKNIL